MNNNMSTWFKTEKRCKRSLNHHFIIGVSALTGLPCMTSRDQLWCVMTSSASHGDAFIVSGTYTSNRRTIIQPLKINPFFGKGLVSELFDPPTYINTIFNFTLYSVKCKFYTFFWNFYTLQCTTFKSLTFPI